MKKLIMHLKNALNWSACSFNTTCISKMHSTITIMRRGYISCKISFNKLTKRIIWIEINDSYAFYESVNEAIEAWKKEV